MMTALLGRSFRRARALLVSLAAILMLFQALVVTAAEYLEEQQGFAQIVALLPVLAQQLMGAIFSSFAAMVAFGYFHPVVVIVFVGLAIVMASEPAADVESGVVDLVLGRPVARAHLVSRSVLVLVLATGGIAALMVTASRLSTATIAPAHAATIPLPALLRLAANLLAVAWVAGAFALAAAAVVRRRATAVGSAGIVALAAYLLNVLGGIVAARAAVRKTIAVSLLPADDDHQRQRCCRLGGRRRDPARRIGVPDRVRLRRVRAPRSLGSVL